MQLNASALVCSLREVTGQSLNSLLSSSYFFMRS